MSVRTGIVSDPIYLLHRDETGTHPERPERILHLLEGLNECKLQEALIPIAARKADETSLEWCHTHAHVERVRRAITNAPGYLDADTYVNVASYEAASSACGGVMAGIDAIVDGTCGNVFCAVRPPGHHAESDRAMGFCLFNNAAVGARYAQRAKNFEKVFILDWDVHHGNGTQEIFYEDDTVFYFSIHQFPLYPGTGRKDETGKGLGKGFTHNVPLPPGCGDREYLQVFENELQSCLDFFKPDLIILSAGFDVHRDDPLAQMNVSTEGFNGLTRIVKEAAGRYCDHKLISVLEGGYDLKALVDSVCAHVRVLAYD